MENMLEDMISYAEKGSDFYVKPNIDFSQIEFVQVLKQSYE